MDALAYVWIGLGSLVVYGRIMMLSNESVSELTKTKGTDSYPIREPIPKNKLQKGLTVVPYYDYFRLRKHFPEDGKSYEERVPIFKNHIRETGKLFIQPDLDATPTEKALFYLDKFSDCSSFLLDIKNGERSFDFSISEKTQLVTFSTGLLLGDWVVYLVPAPSLKLINKWKWTISLTDYKRLYETEGRVKFLALSEDLKDVATVLSSHEEGSPAHTILLHHLETFQNLYEVFETSLAKQGEISDDTYDKAIHLLETFKEAVFDSIQKTEPVLLLEEPVSLESELQSRLDEELVVQREGLLRKQPPLKKGSFL